MPEPHWKPDLKRLSKAVPWRPAPQISDASYPISKARLRTLVKSAARGPRR